MFAAIYGIKYLIENMDAKERNYKKQIIGWMKKWMKVGVIKENIKETLWNFY